jgi:hypothetical protein
MSEIVSMIRHMRARGIDPVVIVEAVEALAAAKDEAIEERRAADRVRKARQRAVQRRDVTDVTDHVTRDIPVEALKTNELCPVTSVEFADSADKNPPPLFSPPFPSPKPLTKTPPIIPPTDEIGGARVSKTKRANGSRLDPDWALPDDWLTDASDIAFKAKQPFSEQEIRNEADKFRDYWHGRAGAAGRKLDWRATWRNWVRSCVERRQIARNAPGSHGPRANGQHGGSSIADAAIRRHLARQNGNGVPDDRGRHDVPAEGDVIEGQLRLVK